MYKSCKIRIYPTQEQRAIIWRHIGACRFVWNYMLAWQQEEYKKGNHKLVSSNEMSSMLPKMKKTEEFGWLKDISSQSLQMVCKNVAYAYMQFFRGTAGYPKFKTKKKSFPSYPLAYEPFRFENGTVMVAKTGKIKVKTDYDFIYKNNLKTSNMRIMYENNKWFLSFSYECETQALELTENPMGIDLGVKELATVAFGGKCEIYHNINKAKKMRNLDKQAKAYLKSINRKYRHSQANNDGKWIKTNNIIKLEEKLRKILHRKTNIRKDYIHQTTKALVKQAPSVVTMENLDISAMLKNKHLRTAIGEAGMKMFINQMRYKCEYYEVPFIQAPKFYPSSKLCSRCGNIKSNLKLSDRTYYCRNCRLQINRDYNAALNLMMYGTHLK